MTSASPEPASARQIQSRFCLALLAILILAAFLRLYALGTYPQMFNQDESTLGYDAWSLWLTGRDQHDQILPIYFRTFDDYVPPVAYYLTAPFVGLLGLNEATSRLPFALMGIATVFLVALLGRRWFSPLAGVLAALLLAVDPWNVNYSRIAFPASCIPFLTAFALYAFTRAAALLDQNPARSRAIIVWLTVSGIAFGLLTGTYPTMKIEAPLLFAICLLAAAPLLWKHRWIAAYFVFVFCFCIDPLLIEQIIDWNNVQQHFNGMSALSRPDWLVQSLGLYVEHYNPSGLFVNGFGGGVSVHPSGVGELFWFEGVLWLIAALGLIRRRFHRGLGFSLILLLVLWFVTYPIADSLTNGDGGTPTTLGLPHEIRSYNFVPLPELLAGFGAELIWMLLKRYRWHRLSAAWIAAAFGGISVIAFCAVFLPYFFGAPVIDQPTPYLAQNYHIGLRPMLNTLNQQVAPCDLVWMTNTDATYIYYLFFSLYPPPRYQQFSITNVGLASPGPRQIGQVHFNTPNQSATMPCSSQPGRTFYLGYYAQLPSGWQQIADFTNKAGLPIWQLMLAPISPNESAVGAQRAAP